MSKEKEEPLELEGTVVEAVKGGFQVQVENMSNTVLCRLGGKLRKHFIRVVPGDKVTIEVSPYDLTKGRITFRHK
jgi:translation initiation factor IF-1